MCGIFKEGEHYRHFHDAGTLPGLYSDDEAARWGCWVQDEDAARLNANGHLITMADVRECMNERLSGVPPQAGSGCQPTASAAISVASSRSGIPNAEVTFDYGGFGRDCEIARLRGALSDIRRRAFHFLTPREALEFCVQRADAALNGK